MQRFLIVIGIFMVLLAGCSFMQREGQLLPETKTNLAQKPVASPSFFTKTSVHPLKEPRGFAMISEWLDSETIMYVEEHDQKSTLKSYHLFSGKTESFFETNEWIIDVKGNEDLSLFSILTYDESDQSSLYVVNNEGQMQLELQQFGDSYSIYWNPYKTDEMMLVTYLPEWNFEVYHVKVGEQTIKPIDVEQTYFQWNSANEVVFLDWDELEPNYEAPLLSYNLQTEEREELVSPIISMMSFSDQLHVQVSVDSIYELYSIYTFSVEGESVSELEMPILNTYSEQWWVPFYEYDPKASAFYYLRPKYSGDYFSYEDGYQLMAFDPRTNAEVSIIEVDQHLPIKLSPDGEMMLIGNRLEEVIILKEKEKIPLLQS
jgi:hypothetical protein